MSRIGNKLISLPEKVSVAVSDAHVSVEGPKGKLEWDLPEGITLEQNDGELQVKRANEDRQVRALHGLSLIHI